jgi:type II secretory pathway component PulF
MRAGSLRAEMRRLEDDLAQGTPLPKALAPRALPEFYKRMLEMGARGNDLPGVLTLVADHYHRADALWTRLKGLLVYPLIVIVVSLGLTTVVSLAFGRGMLALTAELRSPAMTLSVLGMWLPPLLLAGAGVLGVAVVSIPSWRSRLRWRLPPFREASLSELASAMALMLRNGATLAEALALAETLESATPARPALARWRALVEGGQGKPAEWPVDSPFPPLFLWLVQRGGEDVAAGFRKAAEIYQNRASYRTELALCGALPVSVLFLGLMVFWQAAPLVQALVAVMDMLGDSGK